MSKYISSSYFEYLTSDDLTLDGVKQLLGPDLSCANKVNILHECPLFLVLKNEKCTSDIVKLLLQYNSSINCKNIHGTPCLLFALEFSEDEAIIKVLLDNGADGNGKDPLWCSCSLLCHAVHNGASENIIKLLLDAKYTSSVCKYHESLIYCIMGSPMEVVLTEDILDLLIATGTDINSVDKDGCSPLCLALQNGRDVRDIELLMSKGGSLTACQKHDSPMHCATHHDPESLLRADVVRLLLDKKAAMDKVSSCGTPLQYCYDLLMTPLQHALLMTDYEVEAIRLMIDHPSFDASASHEMLGNLLHVAVHNSHCKLGVVQLLIDRGVQVHKETAHGQTQIETALSNGLGSCNNLEIIKLLLKNGCPAERFPETHQTPLRIAVSMNMCCCVLKLLLSAGASIEVLRKCKINLLQLALVQYESEYRPKQFDRVKLLLKCSFLENHDLDIQCLGIDLRGRFRFSQFADECRNELQRMGSHYLGHNYTLLDFASRHRFPQNIASDCFNRMLSILAENLFPVYFDIILAKIGRVSMEAKLVEVPVYTFKLCSGSPCTERRIVLNYQTVCEITKYLSDMDLIQLIIAFFTIKDKLSGIRDLKQNQQCHNIGRC